MQHLIFVTGNNNKFQEAESILGLQLEHTEVELDEVQDMDVEVVVAKKAQTAYEKIRKPLFVDDAGIYVTSWKGFPGALVKFIDKSCGLDTMLKWLKLEKDNSATVVASIGYHDGKEVHTFRGEIHGIFDDRKGEYGWGFDPYFTPQGYKKSWGEMGPDEKNKTSHRRKALEEFKAYLSNSKKGV